MGNALRPTGSVMNRTLSSLLAAVVAVCSLAAFAPGAVAAQARAAPPGGAAALDACTWDKPGQNPFMGDVVAAIDRYADIAPDVRERLRARMVRRAYDDIVTIRRDSIAGRGRYDSTIRDMHFGTRQLCRSVSRAGWRAEMQERGLVYCDSGECILVPTVCRNVSRIARHDDAAKRADAAVEAPLFEVVPTALAEAPTMSMSMSKAEGAVLIGSEATFAQAAGLSAGLDGDEGAGSPGVSGGGMVVGAGGGGGAGNRPSGATGVAAVTPVPEPETWALLLAGLAACAAIRRRAVRASRRG